MAPAMRAMKKAGSSLSQAAVISKVAEKVELKPKAVRTVMTEYFDLAAKELKKNGSFKVCGMVNMKIKSKPAQAARKGINPFTKEPMVFKARPASKAVKVLAMKKLKSLVN